MYMEYLSLGLILKTRGLKGEVKVKSSTDFASSRYKRKNKVCHDESVICPGSHMNKTRWQKI